MCIDDLGVALSCSRPMAVNEAENSNDPQEVCKLWKNCTTCLNSASCYIDADDRLNYFLIFYSSEMTDEFH